MPPALSPHPVIPNLAHLLSLGLTLPVTCLHFELPALLVLEWDWLVLGSLPSFSPAGFSAPQTVSGSFPQRCKTFSIVAPWNSLSPANTLGAASPQISSSGLVILQELGVEDQGGDNIEPSGWGDLFNKGPKQFPKGKTLVSNVVL